LKQARERGRERGDGNAKEKQLEAREFRCFVMWFGYVDDVSLVCTDLKDIDESLKARGEFATKYQVAWAEGKDLWGLLGL
jgi:hypothetical protein